MGGGLCCHKGKQVGEAKSRRGTSEIKIWASRRWGGMADDFKLRTAGATLPLLRGIGRSRRRSEKREAATLENDSELKGFSAQREAAAENWVRRAGGGGAHDGDGCRGKDEKRELAQTAEGKQVANCGSWSLTARLYRMVWLLYNVHDEVNKRPLSKVNRKQN